jgi:hypothetical protein
MMKVASLLRRQRYIYIESAAGSNGSSQDTASVQAAVYQDGQNGSPNVLSRQEQGFWKERKTQFHESRYI